MRQRFLFFLLAMLLACNSGCGWAVQTIDPGTIVDPTTRDHFTKIDGVKYHYVSYPGPGPAVLMLHGFASSTFTWERVAPQLNQRGWSIIALDMKGFGWSDKPRGAAYDPITLMHEVHRFVDELGLHRYALVGHSLGGAIALLSTLERPDRIERLVLIDPAAPRTEHRPTVVGLIGSAPGLWAGRLLFGQWAVDWNLDEVFFDPTRVTEQMRRAYYDRLRTDGALEAQSAVAAAINTPGWAQRAKDLSTIRVPTLILWGEQDRWIPLAVGQALQREIAGSQLRVLPRCGHLLQEEWPDQAAASIGEFLMRPAPASPGPDTAR